MSELPLKFDIQWGTDTGIWKRSSFSVGKMIVKVLVISKEDQMYVVWSDLQKKFVAIRGIDNL